MSTLSKLGLWAIVPSVAVAGWLALFISVNQPGNDEPEQRHLLAGRMEALAKVLDKQDFQPAARGTVTATFVERGSVEPVHSHAVFCFVKDKPNRTVAALIRWIIDEGSVVKKGEKLVQLDDSDHVRQLKDQRIRTAEAHAALLEAKTKLSRTEDEARIDLRLAEIGVKLASLELEKHGGKGTLDKQVFELKVEQAQLNLDKVKLNSASQLESTKAIFAVKKLMHEKELSHQLELEIDIKNCLILAPADGMVIYYVPALGRFGGRQEVVAEGESVREGQKLLTIADLAEWQLSVRFHESQVAQVRKGQKAAVRIDAFPKRNFTGHVSFIADQPDQTGIFASDVKLYVGAIPLDGDLTHLKPQMSGRATITIGERAKVIRVPVKAVLDEKKDKYCYVKVGNEIQVRPVQIGLKGNEFIEIEKGLNEGDQVMVDPRAVIKRLPGS